MSNLNVKEIEELYKEHLGSIPPSDISFKEATHAFQNKVIPEDATSYNQYILACMSGFNPDFEVIQEDSKNLFPYLYGFSPISDTEKFLSSFGLVEGISFADDTSRFVFKKRRELEYNPLYRQIIVAAIVIDPRTADVLVLEQLQPENSRIDGRYTLIGGHVEYSLEALTMDSFTFLKHNLMREFKEELLITKDELVHFQNNLWGNVEDGTEIKYIAAMKDSSVNIEHLGFIYEIEIEGLEEKVKNFFPGEPEKHGLKLIRADEIDTYLKDCDNWLKEVMEPVKEKAKRISRKRR